MLLAQKLDYPKNESELNNLLDNLYTASSKPRNEGFKGLIEVMSSETVIMTAIHNIKANKGSKTPGVDGKVIDYYLQKNYGEVVSEIKDAFQNYKPDAIRRKDIDKESGGKRPLGIPTIRDRIIQECLRIVIEPIAEAKFFKHSYGFRPMRDQKQALARVQYIAHSTDCHYVIEGDIKGFFDNVNHTVLLKQLYHLGVKDKRVLMMIKAMLKAKILKEDRLIDNEKGTPQGGILSPLLANIYLNKFDRWIAREWEEHKQTEGKSSASSAFRTMKKRGMKPTYFVRYADDWVIFTNSKKSAEMLKHKAAQFLKRTLKIELSEEKTKITNVKQSNITFLGFDMKVAKTYNTTKGRKSITRVKPNSERMERKLKQLRADAFKLRTCDDVEVLAERIIKYNSKVRGIINYYESADTVQRTFKEYAWRINSVVFNSLKKFNKKRRTKTIRATESHNLISVHSRYKTKIPYLEVDGVKIGVTSLMFATYKEPKIKNPKETPFSSEGRELYTKRRNKKPLKERADSFVKPELISKTLYKEKLPIYNYEFFMNRAYAYNRDKGKCRVCSEPVYMAHFHHIDPKLPLNEVNKVINIATVHDRCHYKIHDGKDYSHYPKKMWNQIRKLRKRLKLKNELTLTGS